MSAGGGIKINNYIVRGGADGKTPTFKIEYGELKYTFNNWNDTYSLGQVQGDNGQNGSDAPNIIGATFVQSVDTGYKYRFVFDKETDTNKDITFIAPKGNTGSLGNFWLENSPDFTNVGGTHTPQWSVQTKKADNKNTGSGCLLLGTNNNNYHPLQGEVLSNVVMFGSYNTANNTLINANGEKFWSDIGYANTNHQLIGYGNTTDGLNITAIGNSNQINTSARQLDRNTDVTVVGSNNIVESLKSSTIIGNNNKFTLPDDTSFYKYKTTVMLGSYNKSSYSDTVLIGSNLTSYGYGQFLLGKYNRYIDTNDGNSQVNSDDRVILGSGSYGNPRNGLVITEDNVVKIFGNNDITLNTDKNSVITVGALKGILDTKKLYKHNVYITFSAAFSNNNVLTLNPLGRLYISFINSNPTKITANFELSINGDMAYFVANTYTTSNLKNGTVLIKLNSPLRGNINFLDTGNTNLDTVDCDYFYFSSVEYLIDDENNPMIKEIV